MPFPWKSYMEGRAQDREIRKFLDFGADNFPIAAYGGLRQVATTSGIYSLDDTFQKYTDFDTSAFTAPRGTTVDVANSRIAVDLQGIYIFSISLTFSHDESNQGRTTYIRLYNETDEIAGPVNPIGIGRNTPNTNFSSIVPVEVGVAQDGDFWSIEFGGGDSVTGTFDSVDWALWSIGPVQEQISP